MLLVHLRMPAWRELAVGLGPTAAAAVLFSLWPQLDLAVARIFFTNSGHFVVGGPIANAARQIGIDLPLVVLVAMLIAAAARLIGLYRRGPSLRGLAFILITLALGPGLLINVVLKDHTHRPRPVQIQEFGGTATFRPFYRLDGACDRNCSFPSGETSSAVWLVAPALLAPQPLRPIAVGAALVFGLAVGLLRLGVGHHFLSDVVFAAALTLCIIAAMYRLLFGRPAGRFAPNAPDTIVANLRQTGD